MKTGKWKVYAFWIGISELVGLISGWLSMEGMVIYNATVNKPTLTPPAWVFPVVWTILFALMGIGAARVWLKDDLVWKKPGLNIFFTQLVFNFFWPLFFFNAQAFGFSLIWLIALWLLVLGMIWIFRKSDRLAAYLQIPYLLWLTFAAYLNAMVWIMNPR